MKSGYVKIYRKELLSDIWKMPPVYQRVFHYLRLKVKYKTELFPTRKKFGIWLNPGQLLTSINHISQGVAWTEWGVEKAPNKKVIKDVLIWLENNHMIDIESNDKGTYINLVNWRIYHESVADKVTEDTHHDDLRYNSLVDTIKELKKELKKKVKKEGIKQEPVEMQNIFDFWNSQGITKHKTIDKHKSSLNASLKEYSEGEIKKAIINYNTILNDPAYYWTHKWTLKEFLQRGMDKFRDENNPFDNYKARNNKSKTDGNWELLKKAQEGQDGRSGQDEISGVIDWLS